MRSAVAALALCFSSLSFGLTLTDYDWRLTDVAAKGLTKEVLFTRMDREFIKTKSSICSNRALMWANDLKRAHDLDTGKIFLFYTKKKSDLSLRTWWYHVSPVVNENGEIWVLDAGFPGWIKKPLRPLEWLEKFSSSTNCKEIQASETDLVELIFRGQTFPHNTAYGTFDCYYKIVPHTLWTPEIVAMNLLGRDGSGRPVRVERPEIVPNELFQACMEATTGKLRYALGAARKRCKEYAGIVD
jgi:hypothetical protein